MPEYGVLAVEPLGGDVGDKELAAVGIRPGVSHGKATDLMALWVVLQLIFKLITGTAAAGTFWIAALNHKIGEDPMEFGPVIELVPRQENEVIDSLRRFLREELAND